MSTTVEQPQNSPPTLATAGTSDASPNTAAPLAPRLIVAWHIVLMAISVTGFMAAIGPSTDGVPGPIRGLLVGATAVGIFANGFAAVWLRAGRDRGRTLSLVVNYLTFVGAASALLSFVGVFTGLDNFADGFEDGIWFLVIPLIGWAWIVLSRRFVHGAARAPLDVSGRVILAVGVVAFLLKVGLLFAIGHVVDQLTEPSSIIAALLVAPTLASVITLWRAPMRRHFGTTSARHEQLEGLLFLSPNLLGFLFFFAGPLVFSLFISFWDWDALGDKNFVGLSNYFQLFRLDVAVMSSDAEPSSNALRSDFAELWRVDLLGQNIMFSATDKLFWQSMRNIVLFLVLAVPASVLPALLLSNLLNVKLRGVTFFRAVFFIPSIAGVIGISLIWRQLFNSTVGWLNYLLTQALPGDVEINWVSDQGTALLAVVIVFAWMTFGFNTVLFLAGLQGVPKELYEAAQLDGANAWQRFRRITIPLLRPTTFFVVTITMINSIQMFDIVFVLMNPPEGPNNSTLTPVLYLYQQGFQQFSQGYASAVAWVLFAFIFGLTLVQFRRNTTAQEGIG